MTHRSKFASYIAKTSPFPLGFEVIKAEGSRLFDDRGHSYLDFISGIGVSNLGHGHPHIKQAIHDQTEKYLHTMVYGEHIQTPQVNLAEKLISNLPISLNQVYFLSSGAEAIDCAMKIARKFTGHEQIVSFKNSYHGSTYGAMSLMSDVSKTPCFGPALPSVRHADFNNPSSLEFIIGSTAAVVMEVIQAEAGIKLPERDFLIQLSNKCIETGTLLIFDEIQSGMGRTGNLFAFEQYGITPDILVLGKSLGGGLPLSACITGIKTMETLIDPPLTHMTTFGGHPLCCAAGLASLEVLLTTRVMQESRKNATDFVEKIKHHTSIKEIRQAHGLWMAIELTEAGLVQAVIHKAQEKGLLIDWFLFNDCSIRIAPPLNISVSDLHEAADILNECLTSP